MGTRAGNFTDTCTITDSAARASHQVWTIPPSCSLLAPHPPPIRSTPISRHFRPRPASTRNLKPWIQSGSSPILRLIPRLAARQCAHLGRDLLVEGHAIRVNRHRLRLELQIGALTWRRVSRARLLAEGEDGVQMRYLRLSVVGAMGLTLLSACSGTSSPATNGPVATPAAISGHSAPAGATVAAPSVPGASASLITAPPAGTPVAVGDACSLLSPADLKTATGKTYLAGTLDSASGDCNWDTGVGRQFGRSDPCVLHGTAPNFHQASVRERRR